jgi:hypothetical protein
MQAVDIDWIHERAEHKHRANPLDLSPEVALTSFAALPPDLQIPPFYLPQSNRSFREASPIIFGSL